MPISYTVSNSGGLVFQQHDVTCYSALGSVGYTKDCVFSVYGNLLANYEDVDRNAFFSKVVRYINDFAEMGGVVGRISYTKNRYIASVPMDVPLDIGYFSARVVRQPLWHPTSIEFYCAMVDAGVDKRIAFMLAGSANAEGYYSSKWSTAGYFRKGDGHCLNTLSMAEKGIRNIYENGFKSLCPEDRKFHDLFATYQIDSSMLLYNGKYVLDNNWPSFVSSNLQSSPNSFGVRSSSNEQMIMFALKVDKAIKDGTL